MLASIGQTLESYLQFDALSGPGGLGAVYRPTQGQEPGWLQTLERLPKVGPEFVTLLLAFSLCIFVLLAFAVRVLMVIRKLPVPVDPFDMVKPRGFRTLMLGFAVLLTPLVAQGFLPTEGMDARWALVVAYVLDIVLAVALWFLLELFYKARGKHKGRRGA